MTYYLPQVPYQLPLNLIPGFTWDRGQTCSTGSMECSRHCLDSNAYISHFNNQSNVTIAPYNDNLTDLQSYKIMINNCHTHCCKITVALILSEIQERKTILFLPLFFPYTVKIYSLIQWCITRMCYIS